MQLFSVLSAMLVLTGGQQDTLRVARICGERDSATSGSVPLQRVSATRIAKAGAASLAEVLNGFAGLAIRDYGGIGGLKTVNIRGFSAQHTGICYDGEIISDSQSGQVDIGRFSLERLQSASVEIAGSDDIFRSARLAGKVGNVILESARPIFDGKGTNAEVRLRAASFETWSPYIGIQQRLGPHWSLECNADYVNSRGSYPFLLHNGNLITEETRLNSDVSAFRGEVKLRGNFSDNATLMVKMAADGGERGLPGSVILYTQDPTERLWDRNIRVHSIYEKEFFPTLKFKAGAGYSNIWKHYIDSGLAKADDFYRQQEASLTAVLQWQPRPFLALSIAEDIVAGKLDANLYDFAFPERLESHTALAARYSRGAFTATATLLGMSQGERVRKGEAAAPKGRLSPSASVSCRLPTATDLRVRASFRESYRVPTFNDLYYLKVGSPDLQPETARQTNLGLTWFSAKGTRTVSATADGYWNAVENKIVAIPTMFIWRMRNVGRVRMLGADLSASYRDRLCRWLTIDISAHYSFQHAVDITDAEAKNYGHQIAYTPRHCGAAKISLETPWINVHYSADAVGKRYSLSQNTPSFELEAYVDQKISLNREFTLRKIRLFISAEGVNLGGRNYEIIKYYPMPGRQFRLSVKLKY